MSNVTLFTDFSIHANDALEKQLEALKADQQILLVHVLHSNNTESAPLISGIEILRRKKVEKNLEKSLAYIKERGFKASGVIIEEERWHLKMAKIIKDSKQIVLGKSGRGNAPEQKGKFLNKIKSRVEHFLKEDVLVIS